MHILSLTLENTKSHAAAKFDFTDGLNAIVGQNGAGKSTLLEAIGFALFGYMAYSQSDFIREGEKTATITVTIQSGLDNRRYEVTRRVGGSSQYYVYDPELDARLCEGGSDVQTFLKEHMQVDPNASLETIFNDAVGVPQGTLTAAFALTPAKRRTTFDKLLQVEEYENAAKKLNEPQKALREQIQTYDLKITELQTRLERLPQLEDAASARQKKIDKATSAITKVDSALEKVLVKRSKLDEIQQEISTTKNEMTGLIQQADSIEAQHQSAEKALAESTQAEQIVKKNQVSFDAYAAAQIQQREISSKQQERQQLDAACNQIERSMAQARSQLEVSTQQIEDVRSAAALIQKLEPLLKKQIDLEKKQGEIQRQSMQLAEAKRAVVEQEKQQKEVAAQKQKLEAQQADAEKIRQKRVQVDELIKEARNTFRICQQEMDRYKAEAANIKQQTALLQDESTANCPTCEQVLTATHRNKMIERNEQNLATLRTSYGDKKKAESNAESKIQEHEQQVRTLDKQLQQLPRPEEIERLAQQLSAISNSIIAHKAQIEELSTASESSIQIEKELEKIGNPRQETAIAQQKVAQQSIIEQKRQQAQEQVDAQQKELSERQKALKQLANLDDEVAGIMSQLQQHEAAYQAVLANQNAASALQERQTTIKSLQSQQKENAKAQKATAKVLEKLEKKFDQETYQQLLQKEQQLRAQQATIQAQLTALNEEDARDRAEIETLHTYQTQLATIQQQRSKVEREQDALNMVRKLLRQAGPYITRALIHQVSNGAEQIFGDLMQDYSRRLAWNEDYGISLDVDGRQRQFMQLSGGEQMSAALAVRLSLLREMSNIDVAFFDEPTTNLDEMRRESLAKQIVEVKGFRQLFVISHDDTFEQSTENIIRVERKE